MQIRINGNNNITIDPTDVGSDGVLDGNEKRDVGVVVLEGGVGQDGISVTFSVTSGTSALNPASATTDSGGLAKVQLIGAGEAGTVEITASAKLSNGIDVEAKQTIHTSADGPT